METQIFDRQWETFTVTHADHIAELTFNRPDKLNAMSRTMRLELGDFFLDLARETEVHCLIVTGAGRAFSAGGDINDFSATPEEMHDLMGRISHRWFKAFWALPQIVVVAVNGIAAGGGANLALGGDIVIAAEGAAFAQTFQKIGLVPDLGGAFLLPRLVGPQRAKEMALLGDKISAKDAYQMGLVNRIVPAEQLMTEARALANRIAAISPKAVTLTKRMMNRSFEQSMESTLDHEWMAQSFLFGTAESKEGVAAFINKSSKARGD
ncbi:MAG TPA: enoyl-CoA hydratase/isomerase family protein [Rhizobiaceae bacterium]|nr:enoyl-CoA hydratase/isomerase family protein [Rhizobiaceae bacterium]